MDMILRKQDHISNATAILHFQKGVNLLRDRLTGDDEESKTSNSTIGVTLKLASTALSSGDAQTAEQHMYGLRKMVDCRGGLVILDGMHLQAEILR